MSLINLKNKALAQFDVRRHEIRDARDTRLFQNTHFAQLTTYSPGASPESCRIEKTY